MRMLAFFLSVLVSNAKEPKCPQGEVPDINNICIQPKFIEGCHIYESVETCHQCQYKYKRNKTGLCDYQRDSFQSCCLEKVEGKCIACSTGLKLNPDGSCQENYLIGCLEKNNQGICTNCASEYYLEQGKCMNGIRQCVGYLNQGSRKICTACKTNYSLVNNACLKNKILGCEYEVNHKCQRCLDPFRKNGDHCQIPYCSSYNDYGCSGCECGYFLTPKNTCSQIQPGCIRYQRGVCIDCQNHFRLRGGSCMMQGCQQLDFLKCLKCSDQYDLKQDGCRLKNCNVWDNGICFSCQNGYQPRQGKCTKSFQQSTASQRQN